MFYSSDSLPALVSHNTDLPGENMWIRKGETFQSPEQALYLLHSGAIHLEAMTDGSGSQVVGTLLPGDPVGILAKCLAEVRFCYRAIEDCVLQKVSDNFLVHRS
ncbi:cyclic nucleotide-binding domain-containing protein [Klebsiella aerogenes]|uniref:hypothetical protein n=1 Tax=Klebsiella aerogenes TaxID=548 RepID=UPI000DA206B9|nr:hypothetical protein [Klebsiella aerogenes]HCB2860455.1 hypothetical protein [Klebsiella aerogenes]HCB2865465.1 hypothetical protein [Klebsiella aerogenes]HCB2881674.1 hypothetical protein [Klebsiella aerogenes]HCB3346422.1 hypothetical protein [Klebsiella aerogenes]HCM1812523.1 hypothetical protein [Klebsiella aerogenes]